jgi:monooxygenase
MHVDVVIVGAGLSGIGAACHLSRRSPGKSFVILEARGAIGGTWDLFRYPGVRSDSDMFTLGYSFRPWDRPKAIADGTSIRNYIRQTAREHGVEEKIRFHHRVLRAAWSSENAEWTVEAQRSDTGETVVVTCSFLYACSGYYRYDEGHRPALPDVDRFRGPIVHPQHWPEDLDYAGKRVVIIGSGATAVTLVPSMATDAAHVTMLQRSPTYVISLPSRDGLAEVLRRVLPESTAYQLVRWKNVLLTTLHYRLSRWAPRLMRRVLRAVARARLPRGYDVDTHFRPRYDPWDQRLCLVPDGDLFQAISAGRASVVTDQIAGFTEAGVRLASGVHLDADIVITATGLNLLALGGIALTVDGAPVDIGSKIAYKGMMLSGVPNFAFATGYTTIAWTLRSDLISQYVCRLLNHMDRRGHAVCTPVAPERTEVEPMIGLKSGYILRSVDHLPKQGLSSPWRFRENFPYDAVALRFSCLVDEGMRFESIRDGSGGHPAPAARHA